MKFLNKLQNNLKGINFGYITKALYIFYIVLTFVIGYHIIYAKRIIPGVVIGNLNVGGKTYYQALDTLKKHELNYDKKVVLTFQDKTFEIKPEEVGLHYDWESAVSRAFEVGRTKNFLMDIKDKIAGLIKPLYLPAHYEVDDSLLEQKFSFIKAEINQDGKNASVVFDKDKLVVTASNIGRRVSKEDLYNITIESYNTLGFKTYAIPVETDNPTVTEKDITPLLADAEKVVNRTMTLTHEKTKITLDKTQLVEFLQFVVEDGKARMTIDKPRLEAYTELIGQDINKLPKGKVTKVDNNTVTEFEIIDPGLEIDKNKFISEYRDAYFASTPTLAIATKPVDAPSKEKYGILEKLGEGVSKYTGSAQSRVHNLTLAAERTNGVLVPPGEVYSFNKAVGAIDRSTGYATAYVINNGRTVLGDGGGVCQTSTTLFRAVLNTGLPVVSRFPHAYRVRYYEIESPLGLDASIFQPSLDFQFKNDTPNYILIQAEPNIAEYSLKFTIYGTSDGRTVELTEPVVTNQSAPPEPLYQDDPTLAKGVTKQVDFAAWGATASFSRKVSKDGKELFSDTFTTRYQPWRAVFLVGTKK